MDAEVSRTVASREAEANRKKQEELLTPAERAILRNKGALAGD